MTQITGAIPEINSSMVATRDESRKLSYSTNGLVTVDYDSITIRLDKDGKKFNRRTVFEGLEELADAIDSEDLIEPLKGDLLKDGRFILNDGERRYLSLGILRQRSPELHARFAKVKVLVNDKSMTDVDRAIQQDISNSGEQFLPLDQAQLYKDLRDGVLGAPLTPTEIAHRCGKQVPYVADRLKLADATPEERSLILGGKVSVTAYVELTKIEDNADKRVEVVKAKNKEGKKLKVKDVKSSPAVELCNKAMEDLDDALDIINPQGAGKNSILEAQAKIRAIIQIIQ